VTPLEFVVPAEFDGHRLDRFLVSVLPEHSRSQIQKLITDGAVLVRGQGGEGARGPGLFRGEGLERSVKALNLVLQAGGFGLVALDLGDASAVDIRRLPYNTWLRIQRTIEGSDTACVLVGPEPIGRSAGGLTLTFTGRSVWTGASDRSRRLTGAESHVEIHSPRRRVEGTAHVASMALAR
jgi:hypothetical protein